MGAEKELFTQHLIDEESKISELRKNISTALHTPPVKNRTHESAGTIDLDKLADNIMREVVSELSINNVISLYKKGGDNLGLLLTAEYWQSLGYRDKEKY